jgi:hypothetical protein
VAPGLWSKDFVTLELALPQMWWLPQLRHETLEPLREA